jgi:DNA-directed RNA polymerase specialized sigma subunit
MPKKKPKKAAKRKKVNPVDEALDAKTKLAAQRKAEDIELVKAWQADPTPEKLEPLMKRFEPVFRQKVKAWKAPDVSESAMRANLKLHAIGAFRDFDIAQGTAPRTYLEHRLQKSKRFNVQQQNKARIGEAKSYQIGPIQRAQDELREDLGREPTPVEISEFLNPMMSTRKQLTPQKVQEIQAAQIRDVRGSQFESDPVPRAVGRERQVVALLRPALKPDQQEVYDYLYGLNGKPRITSTGELAKKLGKSPSQVSRLRTGIFKTFQQYNQ